MSATALANATVIAASAVVLWILALPRLRNAAIWQATVTPLASIIGSGFLVLAPLLLHEYGNRAPWVMLGLCLLAYAVGSAIRWNLQGMEAAAPPPLARRLDAVASWALAFAYVISVCYYLNLFGAFAVSLAPWHGETVGRGVTTAALLLIAAIGLSRGLRGLERAETLTVSLKLAVIAGLLAGLVLFAARSATQQQLPETVAPVLDMHSLTLAFGLVITVQGFETSRYLGSAYDADTRVRSMRYAQWLSGAIYVLYIGLCGLVFTAAEVPHEETAVIDMMAPVAGVLPGLLVLAALAAQFSAAVADTNGCGGLVEQMSRDRLSSRQAYALLIGAGLVLTWTADIYQIISYASRAFAFYYALQCALAARLAHRAGAARWRSPAYAALALLMLAAAVFGTPAEGE
ncbi:hypothetical protein CSC70_09770 [Pseudoxanthomonas kalamensis DSM 18571]|uniref:hypothetical protein n=1 Tax=Pseudoxanthomonas kalamensis TaxID=289483 RepID=UPI0013911778|nr:hypothetical protein [Pseudoxanthomonas kalamensis]KAF1709960.1 hypothetical protein CSC70_09770 [Pseudoxanthomonas kalamensis DSM 18571]